MNFRGALYLDTSCLFKLFFREPETASVARIVSKEPVVILSELGRLEAETQLRARLVGGLLSRSRQERLSAELSRLLSLDPFTVLPFPEDGFERGRELVRRVDVHCRTLDLLHLAAMEAAGARRLFTNDAAQAKVARACGFEVTTPVA